MGKENCHCSSEALPGSERLWRRVHQDCTFVVDLADETLLVPSTEEVKRVADFRRGIVREDVNGRLREVSTYWREHIVDVHAGGEEDCVKGDESLVVQASVQDVRDRGLMVDHTPEGKEPYPGCAHVAVAIPRGEDGEVLSARFAGSLRLVYPDREVRARLEALQS
jgi:hypothetical protein